FAAVLDANRPVRARAPRQPGRSGRGSDEKPVRAMSRNGCNGLGSTGRSRSPFKILKQIGRRDLQWNLNRAAQAVGLEMQLRAALQLDLDAAFDESRTKTAALRLLDRRPVALAPFDGQNLRTIALALHRPLDFYPPFRSRQRAVFDRVRRQFVQRQRER